MAQHVQQFSTDKPISLYYNKAGISFKHFEHHLSYAPACPASPAAQSVQLPAPGPALYLPVIRHSVHIDRQPESGHSNDDTSGNTKRGALLLLRARRSPAGQAVQPVLTPAAAHSTAQVAQQMVHAP